MYFYSALNDHFCQYTKTDTIACLLSETISSTRKSLQTKTTNLTRDTFDHVKQPFGSLMTQTEANANISDPPDVESVSFIQFLVLPEGKCLQSFSGLWSHSMYLNEAKGLAL